MGRRQATLEKAQLFVKPVLTRQDTGESVELIQLLRHSLSLEQQNIADHEVRYVLVEQCLEFIRELQNTSNEKGEEGLISNDPATPIQDGNLTLTVLALSDLISQLGILPYLQPGVTLPQERRSKSVLKVKPSARIGSVFSSEDSYILANVVSGALDVFWEVKGVLSSILRERLRPDLLCGVTQLAYAPDYPGSQDKFQAAFDEILDEMTTQDMLPLFMSLLHPQVPVWFREQLTSRLSLLPTRPNGVSHVINFIASSQPAATSLDDDLAMTPHGPPISFEVLDQASKLLSSTPRSIPQEQYFHKIAPQLFELLDGKEGPAMSKAAGYLIGSGIIGRKSLGAPDKIGWQLFAEPFLRCLNPHISAGTQEVGGTLTSDIALRDSLKRLNAIITSHPNPGLTKRIAQPIILSLWGIFTVSRQQKSSTEWSLLTMSLLKTLLNSVEGTEQMMTISKSLLWDGPQEWYFAPGEGGGVEIRVRPPNIQPQYHIMASIARLEDRVACFIELLRTGSLGKQAIGNIFVSVTEIWLMPGRRRGHSSASLEVSDVDTLQVITYAKLAEQMLESLKDDIASNSSAVISLASQILEEYLTAKKNKKNDKIQVAELADIFEDSREVHNSAHPDMMPPVEEADDLALIALNLLETMMISSPSHLDEEREKQSNRLNPLLNDIVASRNPSLAITARKVQSILASRGVSDNCATIDSLEVDRKKYLQAMKDLADKQPAVRVEGLADLRDLIAISSPTISLPATTLFLVQTVLTDSDSFVHLAGIRTLVQLAGRDPRLVCRLLADSFIDREEEGGLDCRLAIAETLGEIVNALYSTSSKQKKEMVNASPAMRIAALHRVCEATLTVAGRRPERRKAQAKRDNAAALEEQRKRETSGIGSPQDFQSMLNGADDDTGDIEQADKLIERVIRGWEDTGLEEDVRLRTSAVSILGQVFERALGEAGFASTIIHNGIDLALATLKMETGPPKAILRRAAALLLMGLLRAADAEHEAGRRGAYTGVDWGGIQKTVEWSVEVDQDEIVKGHGQSLLDSLEAFRMKTALGVDSEGRLIHVQKELGLNLDADRPVGRGRPLVEEMD